MELILWISQQTVQKNVTKTWYETWWGENGAEMKYNKIFKDSRYFVHLGMDKYSRGQLEALFYLM